ncbi:MAG: protein-L-isoaspartate(D-aspartate) O-methyltransferase [Calditrichaeota bacterium]|nr:protein-L-isoaspartate(D-aspartate) O-methyltransferase [Calditrichota bacterium]
MEIKDTRLSRVAEAYTRERLEMVESQLVARDIAQPDLLAAFKRVPRHLFVPAIARQQAYADHPLHIGDGQTISQPYIVAYMVERLRLGKGDRVLEIGSGCGYQTAILAELTAEVWSLEIRRTLAEDARRRLHALGYQNVRVLHADGYDGLANQAPFDAIILSAAPPRIPRELISQLGQTGRLIAPVGVENQQLVFVSKTEGELKLEPDLAVRFVPMTR